MFNDGKFAKNFKNGMKVIEYPDGSREEHFNGEKTKFYPNGTVRIIKRDGSTETRWADGRITFKDLANNT